MLKKLLFWGLFCFALTASAENTGDGYEVLTPAQPVQNPAKIEVMEFFWYGCPHCYHLEPAVQEWLKSKPENVEFIRQPAIFSELWGKHAKIYYTAEALGIVDKVHKPIFDAIQNKNPKLDTEEEIAKFFASYGVKDEDFRNAFNSFAVDAKLRQAGGMGKRYNITGVPTIIVNGKYRVTAQSAKTQENMLPVTDKLIQMESQAK
jgi:protein dithiol oxidoreductase (disulfide-forming)